MCLLFIATNLKSQTTVYKRLFGVDSVSYPGSVQQEQFRYYYPNSGVGHGTNLWNNSFEFGSATPSFNELEFLNSNFYIDSFQKTYINDLNNITKSKYEYIKNQGVVTQVKLFYTSPNGIGLKNIYYTNGKVNKIELLPFDSHFDTIICEYEYNNAGKITLFKQKKHKR